jgi:hypothetical protein
VTGDPAMSKDTQHCPGIAAAAWAITGWSAVLVYAIMRLGGISAEALGSELTLWQKVALAANVLFMAFAEGYRGFQRKFSPRTAARVLYLRREAGWIETLLAPFFCVGYFGATARILRLTYIGTLLIVALVVLVHRFPQPWRGIVDAGVVVGLTWGLLSFWYMSWRALWTGEYLVSPEVPGTQPAGGRLGAARDRLPAQR